MTATGDIYQTDLLRLAAEATGAGRLAEADASVTTDNPLCGDRITLDLKLAGGKVSALGHDVKACVLCQAAASVIGRHAVGADSAALKAVAAAVARILKPDGLPAAAPGWPELQAFAPVSGHKSRHACVLLPFRALSQALDLAGQKTVS
ncbi:MAG TPA: iron-sulfur cluster assembly scaffold protein [Candidatus Sulfotelmatobacter sp.]|nr:iron-sulfur cluster assembly scaffold protein [Candidatus Sulfotelmatobacter sp.]